MCSGMLRRSDSISVALSREVDVKVLSGIGAEVEAASCVGRAVVEETVTTGAGAGVVDANRIAAPFLIEWGTGDLVKDFENNAPPLDKIGFALMGRFDTCEENYW
jgi:hypothetical protein